MVRPDAARPERGRQKGDRRRRLQQRVRIIVFHSCLMWPQPAVDKNSDVERILRSKRRMAEIRTEGRTFYAHLYKFDYREILIFAINQ